MLVNHAPQKDSHLTATFKMVLLPILSWVIINVSMKKVNRKTVTIALLIALGPLACAAGNGEPALSR